MLLIADINMINQAHAQCNAAFNLIYHNIYLKQEIIYAGNRHQIRSIKHIVGKKAPRISYLPIFIPEGSIGGFRILNDIRNMFILGRTIKKNNIHDVILYSVNPLTRYFIMLFKNTLLSGIRLQCIYHGELEFLYLVKDVRNPFKKAFWIKNELSLFPKETIRIVLGENILRNLMKLIKIDRRNIIAILHPYNHTYKAFTPSAVYEKTHLVFGAPGFASIRKGSQLLFEIARNVKSRYPQTIFMFCGNAEEVRSYDNGFVEMPSISRMLSDIEYERIMNSLDYTVFTYDTCSYKMIASGALFDSIKFEKPFISLRNDYFESILELAGDIGYLCDSTIEIEQLIISLCMDPQQQRYEEQKKNMQKFKLQNNPIIQAHYLKKQLKIRGFQTTG